MFGILGNMNFPSNLAPLTYSQLVRQKLNSKLPCCRKCRYDNTKHRGELQEVLTNPDSTKHLSEWEIKILDILTELDHEIVRVREDTNNATDVNKRVIATQEHVDNNTEIYKHLKSYMINEGWYADGASVTDCCKIAGPIVIEQELNGVRISPTSADKVMRDVRGEKIPKRIIYKKIH